MNSLTFNCVSVSYYRHYSCIFRASTLVLQFPVLHFLVLHIPVPHFPPTGFTPNLFLHFPVLHFQSTHIPPISPHLVVGPSLLRALWYGMRCLTSRFGAGIQHISTRPQDIPVLGVLVGYSERVRGAYRALRYTNSPLTLTLSSTFQKKITKIHSQVFE